LNVYAEAAVWYHLFCYCGPAGWQ